MQCSDSFPLYDVITLLCGVQATDILSKLYAAHQEGKQTSGVNIEVSSFSQCVFCVDRWGEPCSSDDYWRLHFGMAEF